MFSYHQVLNRLWRLKVCDATVLNLRERTSTKCLEIIICNRGAMMKFSAKTVQNDFLIIKNASLHHNNDFRMTQSSYMIKGFQGTSIGHINRAQSPYVFSDKVYGLTRTKNVAFLRRENRIKVVLFPFS